MKIVIITGQDEKEHALKGIDLGAYDFFRKPIDADDLHVVLRRAMNVYELEKENRRLKSDVERETLEGMLGTSPQMQEVFSGIRKVASTDVSVLLLAKVEQARSWRPEPFIV